jgi:hypothetical protein
MRTSHRLQPSTAHHTSHTSKNLITIVTVPCSIRQSISGGHHLLCTKQSMIKMLFAFKVWTIICNLWLMIIWKKTTSWPNTAALPAMNSYRVTTNLKLWSKMFNRYTTTQKSQVIWRVDRRSTSASFKSFIVTRCKRARWRIIRKRPLIYSSSLKSASQIGMRRSRFRIVTNCVSRSLTRWVRTMIRWCAS